MWLHSTGTLLTEIRLTWESRGWLSPSFSLYFYFALGPRNCAAGLKDRGRSQEVNLSMIMEVMVGLNSMVPEKTVKSNLDLNIFWLLNQEELMKCFCRIWEKGKRLPHQVLTLFRFTSVLKISTLHVGTQRSKVFNSTSKVHSNDVLITNTNMLVLWLLVSYLISSDLHCIIYYFVIWCFAVRFTEIIYLALYPKHKYSYYSLDTIML